MESLDFIIKKVADYVSSKDKVVFALPGGRSVVPFLKRLKEEKLDWNKIHFFMVDERLVKLQDKNSNFRHISEIFFSDLIASGKLSPFNLHPFRVEKGIKEYETELKSFGGMFDIVVFGVGEDGHIGALFPDYSVLDESESFLELHDSPKPPKDRMTASRKLIQNSDMKILLFVGDKRHAYENFLNEKISWKQCPAKIAKENALVYIDFN